VTGTVVTDVNISLVESFLGAADNVIVNGTAGNDTILVSGDDGSVDPFGCIVRPAGVSVSCLSATVHIFGADATNDRLTINALGGDNMVRTTGPHARSDSAH
jgi:hypothetical protein